MRPLATAATFPASAPDRQLDHILTDDPGLRVGAASAELMPISDHRALLVDLDRASKTVLI
ncbi:endonuclease/exonuclease/phosphatase domain protein [Mycobacterium kansasii 824]|nr:endonuclease/exonuclease/phosphatase domain protein [Mycobacterium kansasii 824]